MPPEAKARQMIDEQLHACGWLVQDYRAMHIAAGRGVAIREFPLKTGFADYMLYVDGKAVGVIEAKPEGHSLTGVETQSGKYLDGLPSLLPHYRLPLPFAFEATGSETRFTNYLEPHARSRRLFAFHRPEELLRLVELAEQVRSHLRDMPPLNTERLWKVQIEAIQNLERSFAENRPRALIQMATGSGKTFTAVNICYRLIKYAGAKRILFLVDRNNLGKQTLKEFQDFTSPVNSYQFTEEFAVQRMAKNTIDPAAKVCITTIQRLYSMLKGEKEFREENEEESLFETESALTEGDSKARAAGAEPTKPLPVTYNPDIPIDRFDFIVVDECHRSIYNLWRDVLLYFDAFLIGLTATPSKQTVGFFQQNLVQEYTHEKAVIDGVNVGFQVYRIETKITKDGATLVKDPSVLVPKRDRRTRKKVLEQLDADLPYTGKQLDRDVVNEHQRKLVIQTFKERLPEIFPGRTEVPKTLVFAKTDLHADDIVETIRQEFGRGNEFCQKITSKSHKPDELLQQLRTAYFPRIAVTVDMIATGTDVKPLECLIFMRDIRSTSYFDQMKGRGCRVVDSNTLQSVTRDATHKTHFVIVDAVGVCESPKTTSKPIDRQPTVPLEKLLKLVGAGAVDADITSTLAVRLARLSERIKPEDAEPIAKAAQGKDLTMLANDLRTSIDPDEVDQSARATYAIPDDAEPTEPQLDAVEHGRMSDALRPFLDPKLRDAILAAKTSADQTIDEVTRDTLLRAGFDAKAKEQAQSLITNFKQFIEDHKDEIEALQILYSQPHRAGLRYSQVKELSKALQRPPHLLYPERLWQAYEATEPDKVKAHGGKALVDIVALVRHALDPNTPLAPVGLTVAERYEQWLTDQAAAGVVFTTDQRRWLDAIRDHIAASLRIESDDLDEVPFNQIGGLGRAYELFGERLSTLLEELNQTLAA